MRPPASKLVAGELSFAVAIAIEVGKLVRQVRAIGVWFHDARAENRWWVGGRRESRDET